MKVVEEDFYKAIALLKAGEPVAFPTETVYGLGAPVFNEAAVKKVFAIKGRPSDNPLIAHVCRMEEVERLAVEIPEAFYRLAKAFWPGPLTIVLRRRPEVPAIVSAGHPTIAIRMPSHPMALRLIEAVGEPLVAPSANLSGRPSPTKAADVKEDLKDRMVLDGGECSVGIESTVISLVGPKVLLLRPGSVTQEEIEAVLGEKVGVASKNDPVHSPGMKHAHYAPRAKVRLVLDETQIGEANYLIASEPVGSAPLFDRSNFYSRLREADRLGVEEITIYCDPKMQQDAGLMNRILRAAGLMH
ncbi:MAG: threonylcarbamoyl-AMP synthase [Verrucomicrobia bacterium]|nr:threonylcarbamoyl-AMP synthase [Verrucomicrobiota bacterium]